MQPDGAKPIRRSRRDALPSLPGYWKWAMATYVGRTHEMACRCGTHPVCTTCGRPTRYLQSVFAVRPIGPEVLAS
jgi:hypothetical protein